jgi:putative phosphonate catabolism associated alcohol dehydrogenase
MGERPGLAAVFEGPRRPFALVEYPLRPPGPGEVRVRVALASVCGSDVHAWTGRRPSPVPGILGHEIVGRIEALGADPPRDLRGRPLGMGQRVTWTEYVACGRCPPCRELGLPQKCVAVRKYGHEGVKAPPHLLGGFGRRCYLLPGTGILEVPEALSDAEAVALNCGVATMAAVMEAAAVQPGDVVAVLGAGLLGLYGVAMARAAGAGQVVVLDPVPARLRWAERFGADAGLDAGALSPERLVAHVRERAGRGGADVVLETSGVAETLGGGLALLRTGGRLVTAGLVVPGARVTLDASEIVRRCVTIRGVHNYHPRHLVAALEFVVAHRARLPLGELVDARFPLEEVGAAFGAAVARQAVRPAIVLA